MAWCCKLLFFFITVFNWKSACLPTCSFMPRPPTCLSFRFGARGLAGCQADRGPAQLRFLQQRVCFVQGSHSQIDWNCWCSILGRQGHRFRTHTVFPSEFPKTRFHMCFIRTIRELSSSIYSVFSLVFHQHQRWNSFTALSLRGLPVKLCPVELFCVLTFLKPSECSSGTYDEQNHVSCHHRPPP